MFYPGQVLPDLGKTAITELMAQDNKFWGKNLSAMLQSFEAMLQGDVFLKKILMRDSTKTGWEVQDNKSQKSNHKSQIKENFQNHKLQTILSSDLPDWTFVLLIFEFEIYLEFEY